MQVIFEASCNYDSIEGRGPKKVIAFFESESCAAQIVIGQGPMGKSDGEVKKIFVYKDLEEYRRHKNKMNIDKIRQQALAKLSAEEIKVLNL